MYTRPVIVMSGINHGHFASGDMPSNVKNHDIPVDDGVTFDTAHETIARHVSNFIVATIGQPVDHHQAALDDLKASFLDTKARLQVKNHCFYFIFRLDSTCLDRLGYNEIYTCS